MVDALQLMLAYRTGRPPAAAGTSPALPLVPLAEALGLAGANAWEAARVRELAEFLDECAASAKKTNAEPTLRLFCPLVHAALRAAFLLPSGPSLPDFLAAALVHEHRHAPPPHPLPRPPRPPAAGVRVVRSSRRPAVNTSVVSFVY
ncbi:hypothetical protein M3Y99_01013000 [Aphelenchoides fujianensis]|nr:hypothetical protein M3Y99_01013000 [Aphelenchoides fujianensis]